MAQFRANDLARITFTPDVLQGIPDDVIAEMLNAEAEIIVEAQKRKAEEYGVHDTGATIESIASGKVKTTKNGEKAVYITPKGTREDGVRYSTVAFFNEFGKKGQPARPFIRDANAEAVDAAVDAAEGVYNDYLSTIT